MRRLVTVVVAIVAVVVVVVAITTRNTPDQTRRVDARPMISGAVEPPLSAPPSPAAQTSSLQVVDAESGKPVAGARLGASSTLSDRDGRLALPAHGGLDTWISKTGYIPQRVSFADPPATVRLRAGGHHVRGLVEDMLGGVVESATVCASVGLCTRTSPQGRYDLTVPSGAWTIRAVDEAYFPAKQSVHVFDDLAVDFRLAPGSTIEGRVVDERGEPVAGARISHRGFEVRAGGGYRLRKSVLRGHIISDEHGAFRIGPLAPATYFVHAFSSRGATPDPIAVSVALLENVEGVTLKVERGHAIAGSVRDPDGAPVEGAVVAIHSNNRQRIEVTSDEHGAFRANGLSTRAWAVQVSEGGIPLQRTTPTIIEVVDEDVDDVTLVVEPGVTLRGVVSPAMPASISLVGEGRAMSMHAIMARRIAARLHAQTSEDGAFEIAGVPEGRWRIVAEGAAHLGEEVVDVEHEALSNIEIVLSKGASVEGALVDALGDPIAADVVLVGADRHRTRSDAHGVFTLSNLPAEEFEVQVEVRGASLPLSEKTRVTTREGATSTVALAVEARPTLLQGIVLDSDGEPAPDVMLSAYAKRGDDPSVAISDVDGTFEIDTFDGVRYRVDAQGPPELGSATLEIDDASQPLTLLLRPALSLRGRVLHEGTPVPRFRVRMPAARAIDLHFASDDGMFAIDLSRGGTVTVLADEGVAQLDVASTSDQAASHTFELQPWGRIEGRVQSNDGGPIEGATIELISEAGRRRSIDIMRATPKNTTTSDGSFEVEGVGPGAVEVVARLGDLSVRSESVVVHPGETLQLEPLVVSP